MTPYEVERVQLTPRPTSLNSINGFIFLTDGQRLFFKTHTESHTLIEEYYNAELLSHAGYPMIQPIYRSSQVDKQMLIYEVVESPSVFDLAWEFELGQRTTQDPLWPVLSTAQYAEDEALLQRYRQTLSADFRAINAPIHQLFHHRLVGGRMDTFYRNAVFLLPHGEYHFDELLQTRWTINSQRYDDTLSDIIERAKRLLDPQNIPPETIIGHGDAHNGNVFLREGALVYFDPAFAGRHHPLLDLTKPLFHNVWAMWMYFPQEKASTLLDVHIEGDEWHVFYDDTLPNVRLVFLQGKLRLLEGTLRLLSERGCLPTNWRSFLKSALFCCPFLTMNLSDSARFPPTISLLGLVHSVMMGAESYGQKSLLDDALDAIEQRLQAQL
ncbi:MAG: phosphotransferase [Anaerolineae bacterium]|nr:phosphotransferase [Anaerolineae bacterium]